MKLGLPELGLVVDYPYSTRAKLGECRLCQAATMCVLN